MEVVHGELVTPEFDIAVELHIGRFEYGLKSRGDILRLLVVGGNAISDESEGSAEFLEHVDAQGRELLEKVLGGIQPRGTAADDRDTMNHTAMSR